MVRKYSNGVQRIPARRTSGGEKARWRRLYVRKYYEVLKTRGPDCLGGTVALFGNHVAVIAFGDDELMRKVEDRARRVGKGLYMRRIPWRYNPPV